MKAFFYFLGSAIKWMGSDLSRFFYFHLYLFLVYLLTYLANELNLEIYRLIFTFGIFSPFFLAIYQGIPLNCLDLDSAICREITKK